MLSSLAVLKRCAGVVKSSLSVSVELALLSFTGAGFWGDKMSIILLSVEALRACCIGSSSLDSESDVTSEHASIAVVWLHSVLPAKPIMWM